jgi:1-aminocyclopropane-1-carboxylate deaminase/D-cysteine desulfhydrase-like pyridoxal-dependent ACC family enzyme
MNKNDTDPDQTQADGFPDNMTPEVAEVVEALSAANPNETHDTDALTRVEERGGILVKRDDEFSIAGVCGGKVRTCWHLAQGAVGLVTAGSRRSPQMNIVAHIAKHLGVPCHIFTPEGELEPEVQAAIDAGAAHHAVSPGHNNVLIARADACAQELGFTHIPFGMECEMAVAQTAAQVASLVPYKDRIRRIVIPVGGGMSLCGLLRGLIMHDIRRPVLGVRTGANPYHRLERFAPHGWTDMVVNALELVDKKVDGRKLYHKDGESEWAGMVLDPTYEAKCVPYLRDGDLLWVVGLRQTALSSPSPSVEPGDRWAFDLRTPTPDYRVQNEARFLATPGLWKTLADAKEQAPTGIKHWLEQTTSCQMAVNQAIYHSGRLMDEALVDFDGSHNVYFSGRPHGLARSTAYGHWHFYKAVSGLYDSAVAKMAHVGNKPVDDLTLLVPPDRAFERSSTKVATFIRAWFNGRDLDAEEKEADAAELNQAEGGKDRIERKPKPRPATTLDSIRRRAAVLVADTKRLPNAATQNEALHHIGVKATSEQQKMYAGLDDTGKDNILRGDVEHDLSPGWDVVIRSFVESAQYCPDRVRGRKVLDDARRLIDGAIQELDNPPVDPTDPTPIDAVACPETLDSLAPTTTSDADLDQMLNSLDEVSS